MSEDPQLTSETPARSSAVSAISDTAVSSYDDATNDSISQDNGSVKYFEQAKKKVDAEAYKAKLDSGEITQEQYDELVNNYVRKEIAADCMMDVIGNEELTAMFAQKSTKEDLNFIVRFFRRFVDAIKKVFGGNKKYKQYVYDAEKLLGVFERGVKDYDRKKNSGDAETRSANSQNVKSSRFVEDKYYARQIDKWDNLKNNSYITVGDIGMESPLGKVGIPATKLYFDVSKIKTEMNSHADHLDTNILKQIPKMLDNPIAITEFQPGTNSNTVSVYGELYANGKPVVVGVVVSKGNGGNVISKIRTVHARRDVQNQITDKSILYLRENKKEVNAWFQAVGGINVPLGGTQLGVIRSINLNDIVSQDEPIVNRKFALSGKNTKNAKQTATDTEYLELAKNPEKNEARLSEMVEEAAKKAMPKSLVVDKNGNLLKVYHGSAKKFTEFLHKFLNAHGNSHGRGFYFTENKALAEGYATENGQLLEGYLNIEKPLSEDKVTINKPDLVNLIKATCEAEAKTLVEEGYSDIFEALRDTWVSNYTNTYSANSMADVYREVADIVYSANDNDVEIIAELTNAGAGNESVLTLTRDILGYDGVIFTDDLGHHEYVALVSNQFKSADPVTYDDNGNIIPLSERFNSEKVDIRYAVSGTSPADTARKKAVKALTALAGRNGVARLDKNDFVTEAMKIVEDVMQTGVVSDSVAEDLAKLIYDYSREDAGGASLARSYIDIKSRVFDTGKIYVSDEIKGSIPDYDKFRRQFGTLLSNTESARHDDSVSNVDEVFNDLRMDYPDIFTEDLFGADQLIKLAEVVTDARKYERDGTTVPFSDMYSFDETDVKNSFIEQANDILDEVADFAGVELVDESAVYEALRGADENIDATEYPDEIYLTKDMTDEQVNGLLDKVVKEYPKGSREYKFVQSVLSAENNVKKAQKELKALKNLAKVRDFEVDSKRVVDFTKALAKEFGFDGDIDKTAEVGRGLKKLYDAVSEYIKTGDDAVLDRVVASVGSVVEKVAGYSTSDVDIDKLGGYILDSFVGVDKGRIADFKIPSVEKINRAFGAGLRRKNIGTPRKCLRLC